MENIIDTKQKIINAAINLFAQKDFSSVSTREIAKKAGVNLSLIAYYFKTKEGLYISIINTLIEYGLEFLHEELIAAENISNLSLEDKKDLFFRLIYKYTDFVYSDKLPVNFVLLMVKEQTLLNSKFGKFYQEKVHVFYNALKKLLAAITGRTTNDTTLLIGACALMGQLLSFRLLQQSSLKISKSPNYSHEELQKIKTLLNLQIKSLIERLKLK